MTLPLVRPPAVRSAAFQYEYDVPPVEESVPVMRRRLERLLDDLGLDTFAPCLLLSELLTNALVHAGAPSVLLVLTDGVLYIVVVDPSTAQPVVEQAAWDDEHRRGLVLVDEFADEWGVASLGGRGKAVWAQVAAAA